MKKLVEVYGAYQINMNIEFVLHNDPSFLYNISDEWIYEYPFDFIIHSPTWFITEITASDSYIHHWKDSRQYMLLTKVGASLYETSNLL